MQHHQVEIEIRYDAVTRQYLPVVHFASGRTHEGAWELDAIAAEKQARVMVAGSGNRVAAVRHPAPFHQCRP